MHLKSFKLFMIAIIGLGVLEAAPLKESYSVQSIGKGGLKSKETSSKLGKSPSANTLSPHTSPEFEMVCERFQVHLQKIAPKQKGVSLVFGGSYGGVETPLKDIEFSKGSYFNGTEITTSGQDLNYTSGANAIPCNLFGIGYSIWQSKRYFVHGTIEMQFPSFSSSKTSLFNGMLGDLQYNGNVHADVSLGISCGKLSLYAGPSFALHFFTLNLGLLNDNWPYSTKTNTAFIPGWMIGVGCRFHHRWETSLEFHGYQKDSFDQRFEFDRHGKYAITNAHPGYISFQGMKYLGTFGFTHWNIGLKLGYLL